MLSGYRRDNTSYALCVHLTCFDCVSYMAPEKKNRMRVCRCEWVRTHSCLCVHLHIDTCVSTEFCKDSGDCTL